MTENERAYVDALLLEIAVLRELLNSVDLDTLAHMRARAGTTPSD